MGTTKTITYSDEILEMADLFRAIGHPARLQIIRLLQKETTCFGSKIVAILPLSQSTISKHVSELKKVNLIESKMIKNTIRYTINQTVWLKAIDYFKTNIEDVELFKTSEKLPFKASKRKNPNLKKDNYEFKHLVLKSKKS
jgi:DNA-binding transcriptional ArsR family regulator